MEVAIPERFHLYADHIRQVQEGVYFVDLQRGKDLVRPFE